MHTCRSAAGAATLDGYAYVIGMLDSRIGSLIFVIQSLQGLGEISMICVVVNPFPDVAKYIQHKT